MLHTFTYDSENRQTKEVESTGESVTFIYGSGTVTEINDDGAGSKDTSEYTLNSDGLAVSNDQGMLYTYDSDGHLIQEINVNDQDTTNYTYDSNGNLTGLSEKAPGTSITGVATYNTEKDETRANGLDWQGVGSKNLRTQITITGTYSGSPISYTFDYTYTFNADKADQVSSETETMGALVTGTSYTY